MEEHSERTGKLWGGTGPQDKDVGLGMCSLLKGDTVGDMGSRNTYGCLWAR